MKIESFETTQKRILKMFSFGKNYKQIDDYYPKEPFFYKDFLIGTNGFMAVAFPKQSFENTGNYPVFEQDNLLIDVITRQNMKVKINVFHLLNLIMNRKNANLFLVKIFGCYFPAFRLRQMAYSAFLFGHQFVDLVACYGSGSPFIFEAGEIRFAIMPVPRNRYTYYFRRPVLHFKPSASYAEMIEMNKQHIDPKSIAVVR
jgi:hypothetical protein